MHHLIKEILKKIFQLIFISSAIYILPLQAQNYEVNYKSLSSKIIEGKEPVKICILELIGSKQKLYDGLVQDDVIKNKFLVYPTDVLIENKASLGNELDPENKDFLQALREILSVDYLLHWESFADSNNVFRLTIYSTKNYQKLFDKKFYASVNSNPILDVKKLLLENVEPVYIVSLGELQVNSKPAKVHFQLYRDSTLVKDWTGNERQKVQAGNYRLVSTAEGYKNDERSITISGKKPAIIDLSLEQDVSILPVIYSTNNSISNIREQLQGSNVNITYDLVTGTDDKYNIDLSLIEKASQKPLNINLVSGDLQNVKSGSNKMIVWQFRNELGTNFNLQNYELKMSAQKAGGISWYMYAGGGALLLGGAAALLLKGGSNSSNTTQPPRTKIGAPPPRPAGN